jgi:hypothetical protein
LFAFSCKGSSIYVLLVAQKVYTHLRNSISLFGYIGVINKINVGVFRQIV